MLLLTPQSREELRFVNGLAQPVFDATERGHSSTKTAQLTSGAMKTIDAPQASIPR